MCRHSVLDIATATDWTVLGSNLGEGEIFRTRPDRTWGPPSLLYNGYRVSFQGVRRSGRGIDHPPQCSAKVKERTRLHCHSGPSWPVIGCTLLLTFDSMHFFFFFLLFLMTPYQPHEGTGWFKRTFQTSRVGYQVPLHVRGFQFNSRLY